MYDEIEPRPLESLGLAEPPVAPVRVEQMIERWWQDHFPGSAVARDTQAWNVAHAAKEALKQLLKGSR